MTKEEAVKLFRLDEPYDEDDVRDAYEESFFSVRDYFLKNTVVPQLFVSRLQRLRKFEEAFCALCEKPFEWNNPELPPQPDSENAARIISLKEESLEELLMAYEGKLTEKRMQIAQSWTIPEVVENTIELIEVQQAYHVLFELVGQAELKDSENQTEEVKAAQQVDSGFLLKQLKNRNISEIEENEFQKSLGRELERVKKLNRLLK